MGEIADLAVDSKGGLEYKIRDLSLAEAGRHQIRLAEYEMPGLMELRREYGEEKPLAGARIAGSIHMTV
ncbi:MAG TPA: adenosylhomocysteinase, partial [Candidatus Corynebacterium avicola]|nr:adenosylhomocysteinase [Candidatus Corynebacterium avicola]